MTIAEYIPNRAILADIGSDHAYLPIYSVQKGIVEKAIAGEVNEGPYLTAKTNVMDQKLAHLIDVRLGNGLEVLQPNEVNCITIAGMGGILITEILTQGIDKLESVGRLILQPMNSEPKLREWLIQHSYQILEEHIMKEYDIIYEILIAEPVKQKLTLSHQDIQFGPVLRRGKSILFVEKWQDEINKREKVIHNIIKNGSNVANQAKIQKIQQEILEIKEVL
ncbi:hypothetical protein BHU72_11580 [Desulfuribacillus stibiiarsenatis]|uniref:SAM-dependent methyltransferase n=2 Tax=Desulfuribacillus stibiiarsenatis TaxID=1390249 RepID=A0A1E5L7Z7_9FIRM|nr:hypothetical protein BHU72_11580 [Desulfuribacillus stibiiarsenatis]